MSYPPCYGRAMKMNKITNLIRNLINADRIIQWFGSARLVRRSDGRHELIGGTRADLAAAREWISLFGHDIVLTHPANSRRQLPRFERKFPPLQEIFKFF